MKKAFTLIELLVVILLIALLISVLAPKGHKLLESIKAKIAQKEAKDYIDKLKYQAFISEQNLSLKQVSINRYGVLDEE